jgi:hypothetical protein
LTIVISFLISNYRTFGYGNVLFISSDFFSITVVFSIFTHAFAIINGFSILS